MKNAALISPRVSVAGTKFSRVVAIVPMNTALLSHFCEWKTDEKEVQAKSKIQMKSSVVQVVAEMNPGRQGTQVTK